MGYWNIQKNKLEQLELERFVFPTLSKWLIYNNVQCYGFFVPKMPTLNNGT